jgi:hypothetical protein
MLPELPYGRSHRLDGAIHTEIVVGYAKNEFSFCQPEKLGNIMQRIACVGEDNFAVVTFDIGQQVALLRVAGVIADDDFNVRGRKGTSLDNSGAGQQVVPVRWEQNGKLHGSHFWPAAHWRARHGGPHEDA